MPRKAPKVAARLPKGTTVADLDVLGGLEAPLAKGATELISPLVSFYRNKVEREAATEGFRESVKQFLENADEGKYFSTAWRNASDYLASRWPRVASHIRHSPQVLRDPDALASMEWLPTIKNEPGVLNITPSGIQTVKETPLRAREFVTHEATHAAQMLGNRDASGLYGMMQFLQGYAGNPFEHAATRAGKAARLAQRKHAPKTTAVRDVQQLLEHTRRTIPPHAADIWLQAPQLGDPRILNNWGAVDAILRARTDKDMEMLNYLRSFYHPK